MSSSTSNVHNFFNEFLNQPFGQIPRHDPLNGIRPFEQLFNPNGHQSSLTNTVRPAPATISSNDNSDYMHVFRIHSNKLIAGFLNLSENEGWEQGGEPILAEKFIRYNVVKFFNEQYNAGLITNLFRDIFGQIQPEHSRSILINVMDALTLPADFFIFLNRTFASSCSPRFTRVMQDVGIQGWKNHKVGRIVGNLGSSYDPKKPFFEVIINSHGSHPFSISIQSNEKTMDERRQTLRSLTEAPIGIASSIYFSQLLTKSQDFLNAHTDKLGPNSSRMIEGLCYLETREMKTQSVGNCWMKQPLRTLLAILYLETFSERKELSPEEAWSEAMRLYKLIQLRALDVVEILVNELPSDNPKTNAAKKALENRRTALSN